ncbi:uncharacterized protein LOC125374488 [Haliotis rufescens]|uniref:uncharacterized protein LOC125374488 n=1 Tax=Haliotis rufescens TaxID=6454 RepID=UPI00201F21CC|nr:uncharacterized protein LOC125374488 [Haliotis rufescens]
MPRKKKTCIGRRRKGYTKRGPRQEQGSLSDHTYSSVQSTVLDDYNSRDVLWDEAWNSFFIDICDDPIDIPYLGEAMDSDGCSANEFFVILDSVHKYHPDNDLDTFVDGILQYRKYQLFLSLKKELFRHADELGEFTILRNKREEVNLVQCYDSDVAAVQLSVVIRPSFEATVYAHRRDIGHDHELWIGLPKYFTTVRDVSQLLSKLSTYHVCFGNYEDRFAHLIPVGAGISEGATSTISAYREGDFGANIDGIAYSSTIRSLMCQFLISRRDRCGPCSRYRATLRANARRESLSPKTPKLTSFTHTTHKNMSKMEVIQKYELMKISRNSIQSEMERLKRTISQTISQKGLTLSVSSDSDFSQLLKDHQDEVMHDYPDETSIQRLFWEQQMKYNKIKDKRAMRWHPMVIKWCLYMRSRSRKAYEVAGKSGFIALLSKRTLYDYSHALPSSLGFHPSYSKHLKEEAKSLGMLDIEERSYVGILQDEVKVSEGLVYDKHSGELVGYVDLDRTGNDLLCLEESITGSKPQLANTMLVLMIRGIITDLKYPYAAFATRGITADYLYPILWTAVLNLESIGLKPLFITCDGASSNRKFFSLHEVPELNNFFWTWNRYSHPHRKIYFISDVPHLIKTTRNCFANSGSHKKTRELWKDGRDVSWLHMLKFYEEHVENELFCKTYKLTRDHIDLSPYSTMKVNLAAQIFSSSVGNALEDLYGDPVQETVNLIRHMNRFFDCLNTRSLQEGIIARNSDKKEYRSINDPRLHYLLNEFLDFFKAWEDSVMRRHGQFTLSQRKRMMLSHQTLKGLKISVNSIVECVRFMLTAGAEFVFTHRFNQDPLEEQFGQYRHKGGSNDNPSVYAVKHAFSQMKVLASSALQPIRGNISNKRPQQTLTVDNAALPRRKQRRV